MSSFQPCKKERHWWETTTSSPTSNFIRFTHWGKPIKILRKSVGSWDVIRVPSTGNWSAILGNEVTVLSKHINLLLNDTWVAIVVEFLWRIGSWSNLWFAETGVRSKSACGWRNIEKIRVSHEWIYQYILNDKSQAGDLYTHLRLRKKRKKRYGSQNRRGMILNRVSIEKRPAEVDQRSRIGDWEIDTIIGAHHQGILLSLVECKSRLCLISEQICSKGRANHHQLTGFDQRKSAHRRFW